MMDIINQDHNNYIGYKMHRVIKLFTINEYTAATMKLNRPVIDIYVYI